MPSWFSTTSIVQMSSQGGRMSFPGAGAYSAGKFALEGWSEALAGEVAPFGVRVMIVEPSRFRTSFNAPDVLGFAESSRTYADVLAAVRADMAGASEDLMTKILSNLGEIDGPMSVEVIHRMADTSNVHESMAIAEVAQLLDISTHTLRYYERAGLLTVDRDHRGHRSYGPGAVRRLVFLTRMRLSGMAMRDLQHYVELVDAGDNTVPERLDMLLEHRDTVRQQIRELTLSLAATEYKIITYGGHAGS
jgi:DNA-binding transcriptional MerR regulator